MPEEFNGTLPLFVTSLIVGLLLSVFLLVVSIRILQRRQSSAALVRIWSIMMIVWTPIGLVLGFASELSSDDPMETMFAVLGGVCGGLFSLALPIFLLIWFSRVSIKAEVAGWKP